jgi:flavin-dependent dehydrogenase
MNQHARYDVIVVGAGPGGSTTAALLAMQGVRVLVLEKEHFPRFHIGESLLPAAVEVLGKLGIEVKPDTFLWKSGAQFWCEKTDRVARFDFAEALPGPPRHAYQVERSRFDSMLRDCALSARAEIRHGVRVSDVEILADHVVVKTDKGTETARYFVDASGQDRLLGKQQRSIAPYKHFGKAASFAHYEGIIDAVLQEFAPHNDIRVMLVDEGWAWVIPLAGGRMSIGLVSRQQGQRADDVIDYVASSKAISRWTHGARASSPRLISNFSFETTKAHGARFACVGDAAAFIDPVFSSGVSLAMLGASALSERLVPALATGTEADPALTEHTQAATQRGYATFAALVYRFYNTHFARNFILGAPAAGSLRPSVTSVLAGDVLRPDNQFRDMLLASRLTQNQRLTEESSN